MQTAASLLALTLTCAPLAVPHPAAWDDPSGHTIRFVEVDDDVRLEVLDWGGSGWPVVLLAGSGNTAHVFDELAPKLAGCCHVYGIMRRGYGASSQPASGYDNQRLSDDILRVIERLRIPRPVLAGHSAAGGEMTTLGHQHSDRLSGLVYLDALGDPGDWPASDPAYIALSRRLPPATPRPPCPQDRTSFAAFRLTLECEMRFAFPEAELRNSYLANPDGSVGSFKSPQRIHAAIGAGEIKRDYSRIRVPVLALFEFPRTSLEQLRPEDPQPRTDEERAVVRQFALATKAYVDRWVDNLTRTVPDARIVDLPGAGHYVFITRQADVARHLRQFVARVRNQR